MERPAPKGRGAADNPPNRFEEIAVALDPDLEEISDAPKTRYFKDSSRSILSENDSPDIPFRWGLNPYRGCEHGCVYCYARPTHEYLGFSAGLDFESKILVKTDAPLLLAKKLSSRSWTPETISMSGVTDAYQPAEKTLRVARSCLEVLAQCRNPVFIITKNSLIARDADLLAELARHDAAAVALSITSLDEGVRSAMEPRTSSPKARLEAIRKLAEAGIPVGVMAAPLVPGLTDHELPAILSAAAEAGASFAGYIPLRLPPGVDSIFESWIKRRFPGRADKVLSQLRSMRGGELNDGRFGSRMRGEGAFAAALRGLYKAALSKTGLAGRGPELSSASFRRPRGPQLDLFSA